MNPSLSIAYFISAHGFGHASRACAVMNAIYECWPFARFEIFTQTPEWFFKNSLHVSFAYHNILTDIGLIQTSPFTFDPGKTIDALDQFLPFNDVMVDNLAEKLCRLHCRVIVCDISPLGIAVGRQASIPSVLIENFTWDWLYEYYRKKDIRFQKHIEYLSTIFEGADHRIQAEPACNPDRAHICVPPISREPRSESKCVREQIDVHIDDPLVLITMGGITEACGFTDSLQNFDNKIHFIIPTTSPGIPATGMMKQNVIFLPHNSAYYHPDLVNAADAVVGKVGYSTLAEVYHAGNPFGYITRSNFRESPILESFIKKNMSGMMISEGDFYNGKWLDCIHDLLEFPAYVRKNKNGAEIAARLICDLLVKEQEILDVVDAEGLVIGAAPRKQVHGNNQFLHRVVHVLVFDRKNRLLLQKRSLNKRVAPGRWDTSVGGHVDCGESVEKAMYREMEEELGIRPLDMEFAYQYIHSNDFESELVSTYICKYDGKIVFNRQEIDAVKFWELSEIESQIGKRVLSDNFEDEYKRYRRWVDAGRCNIADLPYAPFISNDC